MTRTPRRLVVRLVAAAAVAGLASCSNSSGSDGSSGAAPRPTAVSTAAASTLASNVCTDLARVQNLVDDNGPADDVRALLKRAANDAATAAFSDPRWVLLASNTQLLRDAFERNDGPGATESIAGVRRACAPVNPLPTPTGG